MTTEQIKAIEKLHPHYQKFKDTGNLYLNHDEVTSLKDVARSLGMEVSNECKSCAPDLLIRIMRHHYLPYKQNQPVKKNGNRS